MADTPPEDDVLELTEEVEDEDEEQEQQEDSQESEDEEVPELSFGDEAAPASGEQESQTIRQMRKELREAQREAAELRRQVAPKTIEVGPKPSFAECDYDEERYEQAVDAWKARKAEAEKAETEAQAAQRQWQEHTEAQTRAYETGKSGLKFPDAAAFADAEADILSEPIRKAVIEVADNPALVMYSLWKRPDKAAELSQIKNPIGLVKAITKLEVNLKVGTRRKAPAPEKITSGSASLAVGSDKTLERLEKDAARTGDRSKVLEYKRSLKSQG